MFFVKCKVLEHLGYYDLNTSRISVITYTGAEKELVVASNLIVNDNLCKLSYFVEISKCLKIIVGGEELYVKKNQIVRMYNLNINLKIAEKETN